MINFKIPFRPMLLKERSKAFDDSTYLFEIKFDGIRATIHLSPTEIKIYNRYQRDITNLFPELENLKNLVTVPTIFDGEIVLFDKNKPNFSRLQERSHLRNTLKIKYLSSNMPVTFIAFDILYYQKDLTNKKLIDRKKILDSISDNDYFIKAKYLLTKGTVLYKNVQKKNLEGIVAKKIDSYYYPGTRTDNWLKIKNFKEEFFFIGGYLINKNNTISLLLGDLKKDKLYYVGKVLLYQDNSLYLEILNSKQIKTSPFVNYAENNLIYIEPVNKCFVKYLEKTKNNHLRHPIIIQKRL